MEFIELLKPDKNLWQNKKSRPTDNLKYIFRHLDVATTMITVVVDHLAKITCRRGQA